jgi:hypothetical protein
MRRKAVCRGIALWMLGGFLAWGILGNSPQVCARVAILITTGTTVIVEGNLARARDVAITNGKRNALEEAVRSLIPEPVAFENYEVINDHIYQHYQRFIDTFRILSEKSRDTLYEVTLESTVAVEKLKRTLVSLGLIEEDQVSETSHFRLCISGVTCPACVETLKQHIQDEMDRIEEVSLYAIRPGEFTLNIAYKGDIGSFRDALLLGRFEGFRLDQEDMGEESLRVWMVVTESEDG